jgi:hypothetical protein
VAALCMASELPPSHDSLGTPPRQFSRNASSRMRTHPAKAL